MQILPIDISLSNIATKLQTHPNLILTASPGSGKTTRVPSYLLKQNAFPNKKILVLVPKRLAAVSAAYRVADENSWNLGQEVGYQVRFEQKVTSNTKLIYMTTGLFIKKMNEAGFWDQIGLIVFDEFHERSSLIDLSLGLCLEKQISGLDIKLLVMSATLNVEKLLQFLPDSSVHDVENRVYELEIIKSKKAQRLQCDQLFVEHLIDTLKLAVKQSERDTLIFLPGLGEMRFVEKQLRQKFLNFGVFLLHGSMRLDEQRALMQPSPQRRLILCTNVAESSITIPSVDLVLDSGLEKKPFYESKIGFSRLEMSRISLFSAQQRAGRAARTSKGFCYQLWHETDERSMPLQIQPEVLNSTLLDETLTLLSSEVSNPEKFSWLDQPQIKFSDIILKLKNWKLIDEENRITALGRLVQSCPLDLERALLFVKLGETGFQTLAARLMGLLETQSFREMQVLDDLQSIQLSEQGQKIENQLLQLRLAENKSSLSFQQQLIAIYFQFFPHKIAQVKSGNSALSSLGRGVELASHLVKNENRYYLLLSGRDLSASITFCDFAIGFTQKEFDDLTKEHIQVFVDYGFDFEKNKIYRTEKKKVGYFTVSESSRAYVNEKSEPEIFKSIFRDYFLDFFKKHPDTIIFFKLYQFTIKKMLELSLKPEFFQEQIHIQNQVYSQIEGLVGSIDEFLQLDLQHYFLMNVTAEVRTIIQKLPLSYKLPSGKSIEIDYESEQAPLISARIQEFFGLKQHPCLVDQKLKMTVQLLAPNYRPTQVTSQLDGFWKTSYPEIRKELKARYPKHAWPEDPTQNTTQTIKK